MGLPAMSNSSTKATVADRMAGVTPALVARQIRSLGDRSVAWLFIAPTILLLLAINIFPLIWTIYLSFTNYRANRPNEVLQWVGLKNYGRILTDSDVWETLQGFALALLVNKQFKGHGFWTTIILLPMMLSPAVVGNFWTFLYQPQIGLFNYVVSFFTGLPPSSFEMIGSVNLAPWSII